MLLDGRDFKVDGFPDGNWLGPTILDYVKPGMRCYDEEIFSPVIAIVRVDTAQEAIDFVNKNAWGNGASIFTESGTMARKFTHEIEAGQVGVNVPIPIPLPMFSFTGNKASFWGNTNFNGKGAIQFFSEIQTVTSRWKERKQ